MYKPGSSQAIPGSCDYGRTELATVDIEYRKWLRTEEGVNSSLPRTKAPVAPMARPVAIRVMPPAIPELVKRVRENMPCWKCDSQDTNEFINYWACQQHTPSQMREELASSAAEYIATRTKENVA
jgi:hypothetical protein